MRTHTNWQPKTKTVQLRLTDTQKANLFSIAHSNGKTVSEFIRLTVLDLPEHREDTSALPEGNRLT